MKLAAAIVMMMVGVVIGSTTNRITPTFSGSNTNGEYVVTDYYPGGTLWNRYEPYRAFDGNTGGTEWYLHFGYWYQSLNTSYVKIDLGSTPTNVNLYRVYFTANYSTNTLLNGWRLQGSTNDSTWIDVDVKSNYCFPNVTVDGKTASDGSSFTNYFSIAEDKVAIYRYLRLYIDGQPPASEYGGANYLRVYELELYNVYTPPPPPPACAVIGSAAGGGQSTFSGNESGITVFK